MRGTRVLLLINELNRTGSVNVAMDLCEGFSKQITLRLLSLYEGQMESRARAIADVDILKPLREVSSPLDRVRRKAYKKYIEASVRQWAPDVIYANSVTTLKILKMLDLPEVPVVLHVHELKSMIDLFAAPYPDQFTKRPARYIAVSEAVKRELVELYRIAEHRIDVIHEFVADSFARPTLVPDHTARRGPVVIGGVGLPDTRKGIELWLQMAAELIRLVGAEQVRFVWVGVRDDAASRVFRAAAHRLGIAQQVEAVPFTDDPLTEYARFDVFAMTSWEDPCPLVVLENMILETPVACFAPSGGAAEEVGCTGIVVPIFSPVEMAHSIADIIWDRPRRLEMGREARKRILGSFLASVQVPKVEQVIAGLTSGVPAELSEQVRI